MALHLRPIRYGDLNARQKENYNFLKLSAVLADHGYMTMRLSDDWQGADFIAQHVTDGGFLKIQLKSRLAFRKGYQGKDLFIAFRSSEGDWYLYPHDRMLARVLEITNIGKTASWKKKRGGYSFPRIPRELSPILRKYKIHRCAMDPLA